MNKDTLQNMMNMAAELIRQAEVLQQEAHSQESEAMNYDYQTTRRCYGLMHNEVFTVQTSTAEAIESLTKAMEAIREMEWLTENRDLIKKEAV